MRGFVRHALAYVTETDVEAYRHADDWEVTRSLADALRKKPFLLVLDGFERILAAYHHLDKAQIRDDQVQEDLRQSTNPLDGDLVRYLVDCAPSKILVTSRLLPKALEDRSVHHALKGLAPRDAESLARAAGVKGSSAIIQNFANLFGCHALVMRVVCGMVNDYAPHPGFFDDWLADESAGGSLRLTDVDERFRNTHVLQFALAALDPAERQLLSRIAVLSDTASYETIRVVSPYESTVELHAALKTLGDRGLLQWDQQANTYDLHPAVRGVAFDQLERTDRAGTYKALRDHFAAMPPEDFKRATELAHLKNSIEVFRLLLGAGLLKEAASHYFGELANALMYSVGAYRVVIELLRELLKAAGPEPWTVLGARPASYVLGGLGIALAHVGEVEQARELEAQTIALDLAEKDWSNLSIEIRNLSLVRGLAARESGIQLSLDLANIAGNTSGAAIAYLSLAHVAASRGEYNEARKLIEKFRSYPTPGRSVYQRGDAELLQASIALEEGTLTGELLDEGESVARASNNLAGQKEFHLLRARWRIARADWSGAVTSVDAAIEIIRRTGERASFPFALRSLALAKLGRPEEALDALQNASNNIYSAQACLELGAIGSAEKCLLKSYKAAWDDGEPYCYKWELQQCRALLAMLAMPEPQLPPHDPARIELLPHEEEVRTAISNHTAKII
jgi:tetratricopeptide (TPR) repeat protein